MMSGDRLSGSGARWSGLRRVAVALAGVGMVLSVLIAAPTVGQAASRTQPDLQAEEAARRAIGLVRSPYCPGLMLEVCPSEPAEVLRDSIRMLAAQGLSSDELVEWMVGNHGEEWRAVPKRQGWGLWAWILPPFALVFGAGFVAVRVRSMRAAHEEKGPEPPSEMTVEERERLDAALAELERLQDQEDVQ